MTQSKIRLSELTPAALLGFCLVQAERKKCYGSKSDNKQDGHILTTCAVVWLHHAWNLPEATDKPLPF